MATDAEAQEVESGVTVQKWIPVSECLPKHGESVLCYKRLGYMQILQFDESTGRWFGWNYIFPSRAVTHWMPLPKQPNGGIK